MAYIKINKKNFFHNLNQFALKTGSVDKIAIVLKDNAYGHGLVLMAKLASEYGIKQAVVITTTEAEQIRDYFEHILVLNGKPFEDDKLSFTIADMRTLKSIDCKAEIELKVDTGMHRNGISMDELGEALETIETKELNLVGVMTHFRSADVLSSELFWQQKSFAKVKSIVLDAGYANVRFHSHNSAGVLRSTLFDEDIARVGIGSYGYNELPEVYDDIVLKPVISLWAKRASTRVLKKGDRVGYGGDFVAPREMVVSTYDLGYGDGWIRGNSKNPYITAENLPILGRVSMDFLSLETDVDEVCIMDDAKMAAKYFDTISYEMTTMLSVSLDRIVV